MQLIEPVIELMHGVAVEDAYRWLEDRDSPDTAAWIHAQQERCEGYFAACPELQIIEAHVREYLVKETVDQPARVGDRYFYRKREGEAEQGSIYVRDCADGIERLLVDPAREGKFVSVGIYRISQDGKLLAYEVRHGGEDRREIRIVDVNQGRDLPDRLVHGYARGFVFATHGYFYVHETSAPSAEHTIRWHKFGSSSTDKIVYRIPRTSGSRLILAGNAQRLGAIQTHTEGTRTIANLVVAEAEEIPSWSEVIRESCRPFSVMFYRNHIFATVETETGSHRIDELSCNGHAIRTIVEEQEGSLQRAVVVRDRIVAAHRIESGAIKIRLWKLTGEQVESVTTPKGGTFQIQLVYDENAASFFYICESFGIPQQIYEHRIDGNASTLWHEREPLNGLPIDCDVEETSFRSADQTVIPLTLVSTRRRNKAPSPALMTSYGGFGVAMTPQFSVLVALMMKLGATFALPHIRGGGEQGKAWHEAGRGRNRQTSFDDFVSAAIWLCERGVTSPKQLAIFGGSNSGLLVAAAMMQRPELFRAVLCIGPLLDMVRYETFDQAAKWRGEYGTVENRDDFRALLAYSPYHQVKSGVNYPATLFVTGDRDERCNPAHVRKMAARLLNRSVQTAPILVDYSEERGHAPVLPLSVRVPALARRIAFLCRELHISIPQGGYDEMPHS